MSVGFRLLLGLWQVRGFCSAARLIVPEAAVSKGSTKSSCLKSRHLKAAASALESYLCRKQGISCEDAAFVCTNSPIFLRKLVDLATNERAGDVCKSPKMSMEPFVEALLEKEGVHEMELFLESIGASSFEFDKQLGSERPLGGQAGLLAGVAIFESVGISRKKLWKIFEHENNLLKLTPAEVNRSFVSLNNLGVNKKHFPGLLRGCPSVLGWNLEEALRPMLEHLEEWGIKEQVVTYFVRSRPHELIKLSNIDHNRFKTLMLQFGLSNSQIARIVQNFPPVLVEFSEDCLEANVKILRELGLTDTEIGKMIFQFPRLSFARRDNYLKLNILYLASIGLEKKSIARFILRHAKLMSEKIEDSLEPKIQFFNGLGLERKHFKNFVSSYFTLTKCSLENNLIPKLMFLEELGMDKSSVAELVIKFPSFLGYSLEQTWKQKIQFLEDLGVSRDKIGRVFIKYPAIITCSIEHNLKPKVKFLKSVGFNAEDITKLVILRPSFLGSSTKSLTDKIDFLRKLGFIVGTYQLARGLGCLFAMRCDLLDSRIDQLVSLGLSHDDVCAMVRMLPTLLQLRHEHLREKVDYLISTMQYSVETLSKFPQFLTYSLEQRIKPRYRLLAWLQANGLLKQDYNIMHGYLHTEAAFMRKYVNLHPGAIVIYRGDVKE
ncbi:hypothetical protein O6H91_Y422500 [Diphasiastrum complanatum]|nr:hypothetical protein O6H91_Y422500 [Diphasiastrum complanatum]